MKRQKPKEKPFEVSYEYEPTPDAEEKLAEIFEFLLADDGKIKPPTIR